MADTKILQAIIDGQANIREAIKNLENKVDTGFKRVDERFDKTDARIDKLGLQIANLEDDAPTRDEFDGLDKRVKKLEKTFATA